MSINYDFMPTSHQARKELWLQLRYPPPSSLKQNSLLRLRSIDINRETSSPDLYWNSRREFHDNNLVLPGEYLQVVDIIGTRVIVKVPNERSVNASNVHPFIANNQKVATESQWHPLKHSAHWGYTTKDWITTINTYKNWTHGSGVPVAYASW